MRHRLNFLRGLAAVSVLTAGASAASAETLRVPKTGTPALTAEVPAGWIATYTRTDELTIKDAPDMAILEVSVISDPALVAKPLDEIAREVLREAEVAPRWTSTGPESIAGLPGQAFIVPVIIDSRPVGTVRLFVAKIDAGHAARLTEITIVKGTTAQEEETLKTIVSGLRIEGR